ncbi:polyamine aminopropyltransferase [Pelagibius sp. Alg239-R121]|uniref:polyamine aminopropyltransferase n=1 Tax=Pelagibius sp. Alg239-R121 TaxID=2993448 RepID=UPI0024A660F5|nr:polyamine aminopropyltransferase [Pelagibius sp. Alg239-R121]
MSGWVEETLHDDLHVKLKIDRILFDSQTEHQHLVIFENETFGRVMALDGVMQTTEKDEFIYHEMLTHLPIYAHGAVRKVLIIGGGDGGMLEEALKHSAIEKVTMVEIDRSVVDLCTTHLPSISNGAFDDPRTDLVIADGRDFVANCEERYDLVIIDSTDPIGPGAVLFTETFYRDCRGCLTEGGILVTQNGVPFMQGEELTSSVSFFRGLFDDATCYLATVPTYVGGPMAFGWATDNPDLRTTALTELESRFKSDPVEARYYSPEVHQGAFALPPYVSELIR